MPKITRWKCTGCDRVIIDRVIPSWRRRDDGPNFNCRFQMAGRGSCDCTKCRLRNWTAADLVPVG